MRGALGMVVALACVLQKRRQLPPDPRHDAAITALYEINGYRLVGCTSLMVVDAAVVLQLREVSLEGMPDNGARKFARTAPTPFEPSTDAPKKHPLKALVDRARGFNVDSGSSPVPACKDGAVYRRSLHGRRRGT